MEKLDEAIEAAYVAHIASLYKVLAQSMLAANGDREELVAAQVRFERGLQFAAEVRVCARTAAGLK